MTLKCVLFILASVKCPDWETPSLSEALKSCGLQCASLLAVLFIYCGFFIRDFLVKVSLVLAFPPSRCCRPLGSVSTSSSQFFQFLRTLFFFLQRVCSGSHGCSQVSLFPVCVFVNCWSLVTLHVFCLFESVLAFVTAQDFSRESPGLVCWLSLSRRGYRSIFFSTVLSQSFVSS